MVLLDADAGREQLAVERARRIVEQRVLDAGLQEQRDADPALRGVDQRAADSDAGKEVRVGDQDLLLRGTDRGKVCALDVAPMAQVVADHEFRGLPADSRHARRAREQRHVAALELDPFVDRPNALHRADDRSQHRAFDADREIDARWPLSRRVHVVDDVDAADKGDAPVHRAQLAMQAPEPVRAELPRRDLRPVLEQHDARGDERSLQRAREIVPRAPAVDQHAHLGAAPRRAAKRRGDDASGVVVGEDVGLEPDFALRAIDCADERREVLPAAAQERNAVAGQEPVHRGRRAVSNLAASAA